MRKMRNTPILFKQEFEKWLVTSGICKPTSAGSYSSYLSAVNLQFDINGSTMCELVEIYHIAGDPFKINQLIIDIVNELYRDDICEITKRPQKTINNWRSALLQYTEFFYFFTVDAESPNWEDNENGEEVIELINENANSVEPTLEKKKPSIIKYNYPVDDLMGNFKFRLITQDRFYNEIFFPISYIKSLMYKNNEKVFFDKWLEAQLNEISIFCKNETHKFKEISELTIHVSGELIEVSITANGVIKQIYTPISNSNELIPFASPNLKSIAIDHVISMKSILIDNLVLLPQLRLITSLFKSIAGKKATVKKYKAVGSVLIKSVESRDVDLIQLKNELELIQTLTKFQLMDRIENIKKGSK